MKKPEEYIIFPLDLHDRERVMSYVRMLKGIVGLYKVGLELFISQGPDIIKSIHDEGNAGIFLDLKLHDIPATVKRAFIAASLYEPEFVTVHCDQGNGILKEVADDNPGGTKILGVTLLTSLSKNDLLNSGYAREYTEELSRMVLLRAQIAKDAGCHGVVCSGHEVAEVKKTLGSDFIVVAPGIRPAWSLVGMDDQKRIMTPADAIRQGADYIVIGRPIRDAKDPAGAAMKIVEEIASAL